MEQETIPSNWTWVKLWDILDFVKGKRPKRVGAKDESPKIPYITIKGFERHIFDKYTDGIGCQLCEIDDILIVWDGARSGLVGKGVAGAIGSTLAKLVYYEINPEPESHYQQLTMHGKLMTATGN